MAKLMVSAFSDEYADSFPEQLADYSAVAREAFADFLRQKYGSVEALSRGWGRPVTWETAAVPRPAARRYALGGVFRDPAREQDVIDYYTFHNEVIADSIYFGDNKRDSETPAEQNTEVAEFSEIDEEDGELPF